MAASFRNVGRGGRGEEGAFTGLRMKEEHGVGDEAGHVDELPEDGAGGQRVVVVGRELTARGAGEHDEEHDDAGYHVDHVEAGEDVDESILDMGCHVEAEVGWLVPL